MWRRIRMTGDLLLYTGGNVLGDCMSEISSSGEQI